MGLVREADDPDWAVGLSGLSRRDYLPVQDRATPETVHFAHFAHSAHSAHSDHSDTSVQNYPIVPPDYSAVPLTGSRVHRNSCPEAVAVS